MYFQSKQKTLQMSLLREYMNLSMLLRKTGCMDCLLCHNIVVQSCVVNQQNGCFKLRSKLTIQTTRSNGCLVQHNNCTCLANFAANFVHFIHYQLCSLYGSPIMCNWLAEQFRIFHPPYMNSLPQFTFTCEMLRTSGSGSTNKSSHSSQIFIDILQPLDLKGLVTELKARKFNKKETPTQVFSCEY